MDITIVIVSYNTQELLTKALDSVKKSMAGLNVETFVVDNDSSDGTQKVIKSNYKWVNFIENKKNLGFSKANNIALKKAKGKYSLILNPDTELERDTLSKMYEYMESCDPKIAVATCSVELPNGNIDLDSRRKFPTPWIAFTHFSRLSRVIPGSKGFDSYYMGHVDDKADHEIDACAGAFMFTRSKVLKDVGYFDEDYFFYGEDLDLCYRIKEAGYQVFYTPIVKIIHHKGIASGIKSHSQQISKATRESKIRALRESTRAMTLFYKKHYVGKYPFFVTVLVIFTIKVIEIIRIFRLKI